MFCEKAKGMEHLGTALVALSPWRATPLAATSFWSQMLSLVHSGVFVILVALVVLVAIVVLVVLVTLVDS